MSPKGLLGKIAGMPNAKVEVCAIYLPGKGLQADALMDGVTVAQPPAMAAAMIAPNARIASY
jgi:intracellular sulfur oxidation DsrE/DsrF family protein